MKTAEKYPSHTSYIRPQIHQELSYIGKQRIIQNALLQGNMFSCDTDNVLVITKELTVDTDDETWTKGIRCIQEAFLAIQNHYDGKTEGGSRN